MIIFAKSHFVKDETEKNKYKENLIPFHGIMNNIQTPHIILNVIFLLYSFHRLFLYINKKFFFRFFRFVSKQIVKKEERKKKTKTSE